MLDLITSTEETHYESYRLAQMETRKFGEPKVKKVDNPKFKEEEEMLRKRFTEQVKLEESRFRQWEQHVSYLCTALYEKADKQLIAERDRLNKDLESAHSTIKALEVSFPIRDRRVWLTDRANWNKSQTTTNKVDQSDDDKPSLRMCTRVTLFG